VDIATTYQTALRERQGRLARLERAHARHGWLRLAAFAVGVAVVVIGGIEMAAWLLVPAGVFLLAAISHARVLTAKAQTDAAVAFYERGLQRIAGDWVGRGRSGDGHTPADHLYSADLDLFGRGSLFELLATTRTRAGEDTLAAWLLTPVDGHVARSRQEAVRELASRLDLREAIALLGDAVKIAIDAPLLRKWATSPITLRSAGMRVGLALLATITCTLWVWWATTGDLGLWALGFTIAQSVAAWGLQTHVRAVIASVDEPAHDLDVLTGLLERLERETFVSPALVALQQGLKGHQSASRDIRRLARLVDVLAWRRNVLFALPAALMLWATQSAFAIEAWRARAGVHIPKWLDLVGELEALLALGGFAAEHPHYVYPSIVDGPPHLEADGLAHPTLGPAVANDVSLGNDGVRLVIVSGSNMSGKSTWLRTLGSTLVLAHLGAPVRARRCVLSPMAIGAAIRVQDSLVDGRSRFFAEITRLKQILDLAHERRGHVLFLLDEILAGTNSHDRRIGADALLRRLVAEGAIGLATTHDLAIGEIVERLPNLASNAHFEDEFSEGTLHFDYRLKPGIVRTSNALALMRSVGLQVD
jgi:hypothetical protein